MSPISAIRSIIPLPFPRKTGKKWDKSGIDDPIIIFKYAPTPDKAAKISEVI